MKDLKVPVFVAVLCIVFASSSAPAGLRLPNLNPFAKKKEPTTTRRFREPETKSFLPSIRLLPKRQPGEPSTLAKINNNTKIMFAKTIDFLNPFNDGDDMPPLHPNVTGSRGIYSGGASFSREEPKKASFLAKLVPWAYRDSEPESLDTVNDFLGQPRLQYR